MKAEICEWGIIEDGRDDDRDWATGCGEEIILAAGTPEENDYKFCPCCGKRIHVRAQAATEGDRDSVRARFKRSEKRRRRRAP